MAILAIDRGTKHIGLAYMEHKIVFPLGSLDNNDQLLYQIAHIITQRKIVEVIVGYPSNQEKVKRYIDAFIRELQFVVPQECAIVRVNEDYSSIQANAREGVYKKTAAEDSLAAVIMLEEYMKGKE